MNALTDQEIVNDLKKQIDVLKRQIDVWLYDTYQGVVQDGPFAGMWIAREVAWPESRLAPLLLGCYEEELHGEIERQVQRLKDKPKAKIAVIGCAEGYYAIGLKRRLPNASVHVVDIDEKALEICAKTAAVNKVELFYGTAEEALDKPDFVLMDCEGAEVSYLDPTKFPNWLGADLVVEIHNLIDQHTEQILLDRFRGSYRIQMVFEAARAPGKYRILATLPSDFRWFAISENRPCLMGWFLMGPRGKFLS